MSNATPNGRIYQWVAPFNGVSQGQFEPISLLNAPNQKNMFTGNFGLKINSYEEVKTEFAFSKNDVNLFSSLDAEDDNGYAYKVMLNSRNRPVGANAKYRFNGGLSYEFNNEFFSFIDRVRYIEFDRDWSFDPNDFNESYNENILNTDLSLRKDALNGVDYRFTLRKRGEAVDGTQHDFNGQKDLGSFRFKASAFAMQNEQVVNSSEWLRYSLDASYRSKWVIPGYRYQVDRNAVRSNLNDQVVSSAMKFEEHAFYLKNSDTLKTTYGIEVQLREDRLPMNGELMDNTVSETYNFFFNTYANPNNRLVLLLTYDLSKLEYVEH